MKAGSVVTSAVLVDVAMYYLAYTFCMAVALGLALYRGYLPGWVKLAMLLFVFAELGVTLFVAALPGGRMSRPTRRLRRFTQLARLLDLVDHAHPESFHDRRLLLRAFVLHTLTFLLDASTAWVAARTLGMTAPFSPASWFRPCSA